MGQLGFHQGNGETTLEAEVQEKAGKCERRHCVQKSEPPGLLGGNEGQATEGTGQRGCWEMLNNRQP